MIIPVCSSLSKILLSEAADNFGVSVAISYDGNTLAMGAYKESSSAIGIDGENDNSAGSSGAVYLC
jgi:hypothetical protein